LCSRLVPIRAPTYPLARTEPTRDDQPARPAEAFAWNTATRDDAKVLSAVYATRAMDDVLVVNQAAFFDELMHYVRELGAWPLLESLDPGLRAGPIYPFVRFVLLTIMRCVSGVASMLAMHDLLLTDETLMALVGFNALQVRDGTTARGSSRRTEPIEVRGALSYETVADNIVSIGPERLAAMFNGAIRCLAAQGVFPVQLDVALDTTDDEATPTYKTDDGREVPRVTREKRPDVRANRHARKVEVTVFGWKVWIVWEATSKIPLAIRIDGINEPDNKHALAVLRQACENVRGYATVRSVALDRGFIDGKLVWAIEQDGIYVYMPARSNMNVTSDAREIARRAEAAHGRGEKVEGAVYRERTEKVTRGSGKNAKVETRTTTVVGVRALPCDWWGPDGDTHKANAKSFEPHTVRATVVLRWDGAPKGAEKEVVILTTDPSDDPFDAFDRYDDRSLIENSCNREAKESWFLERHPKRSEAGVRVQAYFVFFCMAIVAGFRAYKSKTDEAARRGQDTGISRYRRELARKNRDKVIVFKGGYYALLLANELMVLAGMRVQTPFAEQDTPQSILARYGATLQAGIDTS